MTLQVLGIPDGTWRVVDIPYAYIQQYELNKWMPEYREFWETYEGPYITLEHYIRLHHWNELEVNRKTEAQKIMEARHASYAKYSYMDETDLLLLSQHYGELKERKKKHGKKKQLPKTR